MVSIPTDKFVDQCPNGHRIRGNVDLAGQSVQCPRCGSAFVFGETRSAIAGRDERAVTDTGVMRILGDWSPTRNPLDSHAESLTVTGEAEVDVSLTLSDTRFAQNTSCDVRNIPVFTKTVRQIMRPRREAACLDFSASPNDVRKTLVQSPAEWYAVCDRSLDTLLGSIHISQLTRMLEDEFNFSLGNEMQLAKRAIDTTPVARLNMRFKNSPSFMVYVVDEYGTIVGFVTDRELRR